MRTYLAGVKKVAKARGGKFTEEDIGLINAAVKGHGHTEAVRPTRQLMSVELMFHLKQKLSRVQGEEWGQHNKRAFWLLCVWLLWTSCRGGGMAMDTEEGFVGTT